MDTTQIHLEYVHSAQRSQLIVMYAYMEYAQNVNLAII